MKYAIILTIQRKHEGQIEVPDNASSMENEEARDQFVNQYQLTTGEVIVATNVKPIIENKTPKPQT